MSSTLILIVVLLYEVVSIGGVALYLTLKERKARKAAAEHPADNDDFLTAGRTMSWPVLGCSLALGVLGTVKIFGIMEQAWNVGTLVAWFSIATVFPLVAISLGTGRWARRMKVASMPELLYKLFGDKIRIVCCGVLAMQTFITLSLETQGLGIIFNALTRGTLSITQGAIVGGIIGIAYVIVAGMKEMGAVNVINSVVMYIALIAAALCLGGIVPGGWDSFTEYFVSSGQAQALSFWGTPSTFFAFAINNILALTFAQGISQMGLQPAMAAKDERHIKKALWLSGPINGVFGLLTMAIGMVGKYMVETGQMELSTVNAKNAGAMLMVEYLPGWVTALLLAAFLGAILSTFAVTSLGCGALFTNNIWIAKYPNATPKQRTRVTQVIILIVSVISIIMASFLPNIINGVNWSFAWVAPIFFNCIFGMFWKRSAKAAGITFALAWIATLVWTFTPLPAMLGLKGVGVAYISIGVSVVVGLIANAALPGKIAYMKGLRKVCELEGLVSK